MGAVAGRTLAILREFKAQELASTVWAFAKLQVREEALTLALTTRLGELRSLPGAEGSLGHAPKASILDPVANLLSRLTGEMLAEASVQEEEPLEVLLADVEGLLDAATRDER